MKKKFSKKWKKSKQGRKKRKYLANAPLHIKHKLISSNLSKELRKKYGKRSFPIRKGDEVKIMRGEFKGKKGKVNMVDKKNLKVSVEGIQRKKKDGGKVNVHFDASKLQIQTLNLEDKKRGKSLGLKRKSKNEKKSEGEGKGKKEKKNAPKKK